MDFIGQHHQGSAKIEEELVTLNKKNRKSQKILKSSMKYQSSFHHNYLFTKITTSFEKKEVDVPGGMPPEAQELLPLYRIGGWTAWGGGDSNLEEVSQLPGHQVEATLLEDVRVRK